MMNELFETMARLCGCIITILLLAFEDLLLKAAELFESIGSLIFN